MVDLLTFTTLFPSAAQPAHGVFVEQRLRHLVASGSVRSRVVAPVPWFPFRSGRFGRYATFARVPRNETRAGLRVSHPRYPLVPKLGMAVAPALMAAGVGRHVREIVAEEPAIRAIDAHYFYPDGVAAVRIGRAIGLPVVITARGTDINLIPRHPIARRQIVWAARHAAAMITVCQALKDAMVDLGIEGDRITVLRNGVDLERFRPVDREEARRRTGLPERSLLSVGYLIERKGHHIAIEAMRSLPDDVTLAIVGEGEWEERLRRLAESHGVAPRVRFVGSVPHDELRDWFGAADALVLASSREGMANVLLESIACGTPVIATRLWGTPEVVSDPSAGVLMDRRDPASLVEAYGRLRAARPERDATRRFAERFSWEATTRGQLEIFSTIGRPPVT